MLGFEIDRDVYLPLQVDTLSLVLLRLIVIFSMFYLLSFDTRFFRAENFAKVLPFFDSTKFYQKINRF